MTFPISASACSSADAGMPSVKSVADALWVATSTGVKICAGTRLVMLT